ncbi:hypothetical protein [Pseudomonas sp. KCJK8751]|uniref:hypothetical protein n=1 Tax=Pseudomonas sp. KCJK8751 TaxID=3344564 RepID=UPI003905FF29
MNNPNPLNVELSVDVLDALEDYVRALEVYQQSPNDLPTAEYDAVERAYRLKAQRVAEWLVANLDLKAVPGTLGEALAESERNREARMLARDAAKRS